METDRAAALIERFAALADAAFTPPALDAAVAEAVLGASGRPLAPHRRLLERVNGAYLHGGALHLFGASEGPAWHGLAPWNAESTWRDAYRGAADGLVFFAEDAFGDQFAYQGLAHEVVVFEAELGRVVPAAPSFLEWLEEMSERPAALLPVDVIAERRSREPPALDEHRPGTHLFAYPPLFSVESREGVTIGRVDAVEAMRFRGELAGKVRDLPGGTRIQIRLEP